MARKKRGAGRSAFDAVAPRDPQAFARSLKHRHEAARGVEQELLTNVPLLYGSPGEAGDPGIVLARAHREDMLRRHGSSFPRASGSRSEVRLPFERATGALAILLSLLFFFAD
jgi:hypothetical protein